MGLGQPPTAERWLISVTVMITTVMVVLDITIVNVALPHMMGSLGATSEQIGWVLTSYLVASAIVMPLTGYLSARLGRKRLMVWSVVAFVAASALCGVAQGINEMVLFRALQGAFGAPLVPLSQSLMVDSFPAHERGKAMAVWGMGVMVGPVMGPTLGGVLTQHLDWRWVFYINVPVGLLAVLLASSVLPTSARSKMRTDWTGLLLMAAGIGGLQLVLDRGNQDDWFASNLILATTLLGAAAFIWFVARGWRRADNIVNLHLFTDRNFATACLMIGAFGLGVFGTIAVQPLLLEGLLGYPPQTTGYVMAPRGMASALSMMLAGRLIARRDPRLLVGVGLILAALGTHVMTRYSLDISPGWVLWPGVLQGLGLGMIFVPLSSIAFDTLPGSASAEAAGLFSLIRTLGGSVGISAVSTVLSRQGQASWHGLGGAVSPFNPSLQTWLDRTGLNLGDTLAPQILAKELSRQSTMVAYADVFWVITAGFVLLLPVLVLMRRPHHQQHRGNGPID